MIGALLIAGVATVAIIHASSRSVRAEQSAQTGLSTPTTNTEANTTPATAPVETNAETNPAPAETAGEPEQSQSSSSQLFHPEGGKVACEASTNSARCSVASINETFVLPEDGESAYREAGLAVAEESGELAAWGTTVSVGSVTCTVPASNEPHGIICRDSATGHGFQASMVKSRQQVY